MNNYVTKFIFVLLISLPIFLNAAQVKQKGFRFDTPWLGVMLEEVSTESLKKMDLSNGVKITNVFENSPADKAGLEKGDIVITFDGEKVSNPKELSSQVKMKKENDKVDLEYYRNGKTNSSTVTIEKRKSPQVFMPKKPHILKKKIHHSQNSVFLGVKVESLTEQLRKYFDVSDGMGVLVSEVLKDSPAEKAGLKAGDVITKVEDREVKNYNDLIRGLNYFDPNDEVDIYFVRDKSKKSVEVILAKPENRFEKMMWIDDNDFMHDFDFDFHELNDKDIDEDEIEINMDGLDKTIKIEKEIIGKDEV